MCGIVAYVGQAPAAPRLLHALRRLEYRGYDSVGVAVATRSGRTASVRSTLRVEALEQALRASIHEQPDIGEGGSGIGHTRWATTGGVVDSNAHPFDDCSGRLSVAHNGIIENAPQLRALLEGAGHVFTSAVDSEVIVHLVEDGLRHTGSLHTALEIAVSQLLGTWAVVVLDAESGHVAAAADGSPLVVARTPEGAYVASDVNAITAWIQDFRVLDDGDTVEIGWLSDTWRRRGASIPLPALHPARWTHDAMQSEVDGDRMGIEIRQQPEVAARVLDALAGGIADGALWESLGLPHFDRVAVLSCGTSLNAGRTLAAVLGSLGGFPTQLIVASEARDVVIEPRTLTVALSQSGETADVLHAIDDLVPHALLAITNNPTSTLARRAHAVIDVLAGPEIGVAATKTFVAQVVAGAALALSALVANGRLDRRSAGAFTDALLRTPENLATALELVGERVPLLAHQLADSQGFLFLGRGTGLIYAREGCLKLEELTYRWAQAIPAGELKHGPLALVEDGTPVFAVESGDPRLALSLAAVRARGGRVITLGDSGADISLSRPGGEHRSYAEAPWGPLASVIPLQLFARHVALELHLDVDKPRNLAKSVTVD